MARGPERRGFGQIQDVVFSNVLLSLSMPDSAEQLQQIYLAGFELQTFDRFPKCIGVVRDECVALLVPGVDGLQILGMPGWRLGESIGVLTEVAGEKVFQAKDQIVEASPERLETLRHFNTDLLAILRPSA
jgi:hypothetical protein